MLECVEVGVAGIVVVLLFPVEALEELVVDDVTVTLGVVVLEVVEEAAPPPPAVDWPEADAVSEALVVLVSDEPEVDPGVTEVEIEACAAC